MWITKTKGAVNDLSRSIIMVDDAMILMCPAKLHILRCHFKICSSRFLPHLQSYWGTKTGRRSD